MTAIKRRYIHFAIMFLLTIIICMCPATGHITAYGMKALGVFVGVLYGWIFIDLIWPSIFGFIALAITGVMPVTQALSSGFGNMTFLMMATVLAFAGVLEATGLADFLSTYLLKKHFFRKSPWRLIVGFCIIGYLLGIGNASIASCLLLWSIFFHCVDNCDISKSDPLVSFVVFMIVVASFSGNYILPFSSGAAIFLGFYTESMQTAMPFIPYIIVLVVTTLLNIALTMILGKYLLKVDASKLVIPEEVVKKLDSKKTTKQQKIGFVALIVYICALLLPEIIPGVPGMMFLKTLGLIGISVLGILVLGFLSVAGEPVVDLEKAFKNSMSWSLLMLLAITFPLADSLKSEDAGIMATINQVVMPVVSNMGPYALLIAIMIILGILTQFTHNIVLGAMFIPFLCPMIEEIGGNATTMYIIIFLALSAALVTPAGSAQAALLHGHESADRKSMYLMGIINLIAMWIILAVATIPLSNALF